MIALRIHVHSSDTSFLYVAIAFGVVVIIYHLYFTRQAKIKRNLRKVTEKDISEIQDGEIVKVTGEVRFLGSVLKAPLSGRKCVYWHVIVDERGNKSTYTIIDKEHAADVILKNGNQYVVVDTGEVNTYLLKDADYSSGFLNDASDTLERFLKRHEESSTGILGMNRSITYKEGVLEEGEMVAVVGTAEWVKKSRFRYNLPVERVLLIKASENSDVYMSDDPSTV